MLRANPSGKNSIRCQTYAKTEDHIELKLCFSARHPQHRFSAQRKMQHLGISWRNPCIWRLDFCQIIKSCSCFWMDHKSKQVDNLIKRFRSIYDVRRGARWLSGGVSDSGARGSGFETYRRRVVSLSKTLYSPKVLVNYPGSDGSVPTWLKNCWLGR